MPNNKLAFLGSQTWETLCTLGLSELVHLTANESSKELLGKSVADGFAFWLLVRRLYKDDMWWRVLPYPLCVGGPRRA